MYKQIQCKQTQKDSQLNTCSIVLSGLTALSPASSINMFSNLSEQIKFETEELQTNKTQAIYI